MTNQNQNTDPIRPDPIEDSDGKDDFTEGKSYIEEVHKVTVNGDLEAKVQYIVSKDSGLERFLDTILKTIAGRTDVGRIVGEGKDIAKYVLPYGEQIDALTDKVGELARNELQPNNEQMAQLKEGTFNKIIRFLKQESTRRGVALVVGLAGGWLGFDINPEDLMTSIISGVTGASLIYASWKNIKDIFVDEDQR